MVLGYDLKSISLFLMCVHPLAAAVVVNSLKCITSEQRKGETTQRHRYEHVLHVECHSLTVVFTSPVVLL